MLPAQTLAKALFCRAVHLSWPDRYLRRRLSALSDKVLSWGETKVHTAPLPFAIFFGGSGSWSLWNITFKNCFHPRQTIYHIRQYRHLLHHTHIFGLQVKEKKLPELRLSLSLSKMLLCHEKLTTYGHCYGDSMCHRKTFITMTVPWCFGLKQRVLVM